MKRPLITLAILWGLFTLHLHYDARRAHEVYRLQNENEAIRAAMREAMRIGGDRVVEAVRKWVSK